VTVVVVAFAFLAQILLALGPASCGQQLRPCCGGPNQVLVVVVTDLKCRMTATRISSAPPRGAYESFAQGCNPLSGGVGQRANSLAVIRHANFCVLRYGTMSFRCRGCPSPVFVAGPPSHPYLLSRNTYSLGEPTSLDYRGPAGSGMTLTAIIPLRAKERYHPSSFSSASRGDGTGVRHTRRTGIAPGNRPSAARH
jgi:hypothetical protein